MAERETYVTQLELYRHTEKIKQELQGDIKLVSQNVGSLERSMNKLEKLVLPLAVSLEAIKENTGELNTTMKDFVKEQKEHRDKLHTHDVAIIELQRDDEIKLENTKGKWQILGIVLGSGGAFSIIINIWGTQLSKWIFGG